MVKLCLWGGQYREILRRGGLKNRKNCRKLKKSHFDIDSADQMCYNVENIFCPRVTDVYLYRVDISARGRKMFQNCYFSGESHRDIR